MSGDYDKGSKEKQPGEWAPDTKPVDADPVEKSPEAPPGDGSPPEKG